MRTRPCVAGFGTFLISNLKNKEWEMKTGWIVNLIMGFIIVVNSWVFPSFSLSETANRQQLQTISENRTLAVSQLDLNNPCLGLDEKFKMVCEYLDIKGLIDNNIVDPGKHELKNFLETVRRANDILVNPGTFSRLSKHPVKLVRNLGFSSIADLAKAVCGPALLVRPVRLSELAKFKEGEEDPFAPIDPGYTMIVPLDDPDAKISKSSIWFSLKSKEKEWRWTRRGFPSMIRKIHLHRSGAQEVIEVPGLNLRFLGLRKGEQLSLIPLKSVRIGKLDLKEGIAEPASEVWAKLAPVAKSIVDRSKDILDPSAIGERLRNSLGVSRPPAH